MSDLIAYYYDEHDNEHSVEVTVTHYRHQPPNPSSWDSPDDYYGYTEFEWEADEPVPEWAVDTVHDQVERLVKGEL